LTILTLFEKVLILHKTVKRIFPFKIFILQTHFTIFKCLLTAGVRHETVEDLTMKKHLFVCLSLLMLSGTILTGCDSNSSDSKGKESILRVNISTEPPTLDPGKMTDSTSSNILTMLFDTLVRKDLDQELVPSLAQKIDISEDGTQYTFTLRKNALWSNGEPITANDFEFAWKRILDPSFASASASLMYLIKNAEPANSGEVSLDEVGVKAIDDHTLVVNLEFPAAYFLELVSNSNFSPVNKKAATANPKWAFEAGTSYICCGPFKLDEWKHNNYISVKKNANYWDKDSVSLDQVKVTIVPDSSTELSLFENGDLDWAGAPLSSLPTDAIPSLKESNQLTVYQTAGTYYYEFNTQDPLLSNPKMRKALAYSINRQTIVDNITQLDQEPALGLVPPTIRKNDKKFFKDFDIEKSKELFNEALEEMGMTRKTMPSLSLSFNQGAEGHQKIAQAIQQQWKKNLGIEVTLHTSEWNVYLDDMRNHNFQIGRMAWLADVSDPIDFLNVFRDENHGSNHAQWQSDEFQELLAESNRTLDKDKRNSLLLEAEGILMDEMPLAPIYHYTMAYLKKPNVHGVNLGARGHVDFKWAYLSQN
jgi:oligopeptide transport system substrate-binding protein